MKWLVVVVNALSLCFALYVFQGAEGLSPIADLEGAGVRRMGQYVMFVSLGKASLLLSAASAVVAILFMVLQGPTRREGGKQVDRG